jgi:hypothetical protein
MDALRFVTGGLRRQNPNLRFQGHGEAYLSTLGTPFQASRTGRGLEEAAWRNQLFNGGDVPQPPSPAPPPVPPDFQWETAMGGTNPAGQPTPPPPVQSRSITAFAREPAPTPPAPAAQPQPPPVTPPPTSSPTPTPPDFQWEVAMGGRNPNARDAIGPWATATTPATNSDIQRAVGNALANYRATDPRMNPTAAALLNAPPPMPAPPAAWLFNQQNQSPRMRRYTGMFG